jgi:hypothetical protein
LHCIFNLLQQLLTEYDSSKGLLCFFNGQAGSSGGIYSLKLPPR